VKNAGQLPGRPDYYLPGFRLAIFADGCFWHSCPVHGRLPEDNRDYWQSKLSRTVARDREVAIELREMGVRSIRLWEHDLRKRNIDGAITNVKLEVARLMAPSG